MPDYLYFFVYFRFLLARQSDFTFLEMPSFANNFPQMFLQSEPSAIIVYKYTNVAFSILPGGNEIHLTTRKHTKER